MYGLLFSLQVGVSDIATVQDIENLKTQVSPESKVTAICWLNQSRPPNDRLASYPLTHSFCYVFTVFLCV